jgi:uncharacterized protein (TIGR00251 family)
VTDSNTLSFEALIKTNARHTEIVADESGLRISVKAPPVSGQANREAIKLIARKLGVPQKSVQLVRGMRGRQKIFRVTGLECLPEDLRTLSRMGK